VDILLVRGGKMMKRIALFLAVIMVLTIAAPVLAANPFTDVPMGHWAYDAISEVAELGIMKGAPEGDFEGEREMTRYEMAVTTARIAEMVEKNGVQLSAGEEAEVQDLLSALKAEFTDELDLLKADVDQNQKDLDALQEKVDTNRKIGIAAIVLSLVAVASN
jgi:hypothetical protein